MYPDVAESGLDPWHHYVLKGRKEGRDNGLHPKKDMFFPEGYLEMYPDVAESGIAPWRHYVLSGKKEGRDNGLHPKEELFFPEGYLEMYPDIAEEGLDPWRHYVLYGKKDGRDNGLHPMAELFFPEGYLEMYHDVADAGIDPWRHYVLYGKKDGRGNGLHPKNDQFFAAGYLEMYPEIAEAELTPWRHYVLSGKKDGRDNGLHPAEGIFFADGYLEMYHDVADAGIDPWRHYVLSGKREGRDNGLHPNADAFFAAGYLEMYPDVAKAGVDPWHHYVLVGKKEGRDNGLHPNDDAFFAAGYLVMYPDVAQAGVDPWHHYVLAGKSEGRDNGLHPADALFFPEGYLEMYPDVAQAGADPWHHYVLAGKSEGRDNGLHPSEGMIFPAGYIEMYPDVAGSGEEPWHHYVLFGRKAGRDNGYHPSDDMFYADGYLRKYPDVAAAKLDPWRHYVQSGKKEGRDCCVSKPITWPAAWHLYARNILIITEDHPYGGRNRRADQKVEALAGFGYKSFVCSMSDKAACMNLLQKCAAVVFYNVPYVDSVIEYCREARRLGARIIYEADGLTLNEDACRRELQEYGISEEEKTSLINSAKARLDAMLQADETWFSTRTLCDESDKEYGTHGVFIPSAISEELSGAAKEFAGDKKDSKAVRVVCLAGSPYGNGLGLIQNELEEILIRNENVQLVLTGSIEFDCRRSALQGRIIQTGWLEHKDYYYLISQCDIAIMPGPSGQFNASASNTGYIEASALSIPSVCCDVPELSAAVRNGKDGFIARSSDEWLSDLQKLIDDRELRHAIGKAAHETVLQSCSLNRLGRQLVSLLEPYAVTNGGRQSVLIVNVLYGVSSFGGATVVAEKLAEELQANGSYDVNVFSAYTDLHEDYGILKRYTWNGVKVWAVNVYDISLDYINTRLKDVFAEVLDLVSPKLVHFHCVQTLGMDMCLECSERKVPYFVTIHDGWWNCVRQFMVDNSGNYCGDEVSSCALCKARCGISGADFYRKRHLAHLVLRNAEKVYTPSHYFSALIQRNFPSVPIYTNKNGIIQNDKTAACRKTEAENERERIVLGFFGGRELVKGYFLLRECIDSFGGDIDNFKLVLIDTARRDGREGGMMNDGWPLDVEINGYTPHEKMYEMYQKIDVLLFPSMLKESFGLMVREAIYNDVFVVCSDCGGPSEAIVNNENGLIFPMGDKDKFMECLRFLIKNKDFIKNYRTKNFQPVRLN